jgi:hypothetical protein
VNDLIINWREELIKLFPDTTQRTKGEHDEWCSVCNGLGLINKGNYVVGCTACNGRGVKKACECGQIIDRPYYDACSSCRSKKFNEQQEQKERERFEAASKILFEDYTGLFLWNDRAITGEDLEEEMYSLIYDGEEPPNFIWGTEKHKVFKDIDLAEVVSNKCEDGYEDMSDHFDFKDVDFVKAQELLNLWLAKHDSATDIYYEDYKTAVLLDKVIEDIKQQIEREKNRNN